MQLTLRNLGVIATLALTLGGCTGTTAPDGYGPITIGGTTTGNTSTANGVLGSGADGIQAGVLTAGDYDDQLNPAAYFNYASQFLAAANTMLPYIDLGSRVAVNVVNMQGQPMAGAKVKVAVAGDDFLQLITPASGLVYLYKAFDNLPQTFELVVSDNTEDTQVTQTVDLASVSDRGVTVTLDKEAVVPTELDLMLVIDATGSMADELTYLQAELTEILNQLTQSHPLLAINIGLIVYRDELLEPNKQEEYVLRSYPLTGDILKIQRALNIQKAAGGGDLPEAMDQALGQAIMSNWRTTSQKIILLVADAPPHDDDIQTTWNYVLQARSQQIHIVPVAASGVDDSAEFLMRAMAAATHSRYLFLTDDSGVGNSHAEPTIDCYVVTRLNNTIARVLDSLISGERIEPEVNDVIRTSGIYDQGVCQDPNMAQ